MGNILQIIIFYILLGIFIAKPISSASYGRTVGSTLFYKRQIQSGCWNREDYAKLVARRLFEDVAPPNVSPERVNSKYVKDSLKYYKRALRAVGKDQDLETGELLKEALADTLGAHLRAEILPTARFAYYAGYVPYREVRKLHDFYDSLKSYLNTYGIGWKEPERVPQWTNLTVAKVSVGPGRLFDPCVYLITKRDAHTCVHLPTPKHDDDNVPAAVAFPFKSGGMLSLTSPNSENVLLKYYTTASRCILHSSPPSCRHSDFVNFNNDLWHWMKRDVAPHLMDEKLYSAFGGVFRVAAAVQNYGKGLGRRNLYEKTAADPKKWYPWQHLTEPYVSLNAHCSPKLYVIFVLITAALIWVLHLCYYYTFGDNSCPCGKRRFVPKTETKQIYYAKVDSNLPAVLPQHEDLNDDETKQFKQTPSRCKSQASSVMTQRVYDLNENKEKMMDIIMSDTESITESSGTEEEEQTDEASDRENESKVRTPSPPKIETPISQLRLKRMSYYSDRSSKAPYQTSSASHSETTRRKRRDSDSTESGSDTSAQSVTSTGTKSKLTYTRTRSSRELPWMGSVMSKLSRTTKSETGTEIDILSYTTPPSRRNK